MAQQDIDYGTTANDGNGESFRSAFVKIQGNFTNLYDFMTYKNGELIMNNAKAVSDDDDLYAHDSRVLAVNYGTTELILIAYQSDKNSASEMQATQYIRLIVYNAHTKAILQSIEIAKGNTEYNGITLANSAVAIPKLIDLGTGSIRIIFSNGDNVYYRDIALSNYALGNLTVFQAKIRNAADDGWDDAADLTIANLSTHCERCGGGAIPSAAPTYTLMPVVRGMDSIQQVGSYYYMSCEAYYANSGDYGIAFLMRSEDLSAWEILPPVALDTTTPTNNKTAETSFVYIDSKWHAISRATNLLYASSEDDGFTWSAQAAPALTNPSSPKTSVCYVNVQTGAEAYRPTAFLAYQKDSLIYKATLNRTTMGMAISEDMVAFVDIAILVNYRTNHYPSICYHNGLIYMTFTTTLNVTNTDRNTIMLAVFNPYQNLVINEL